MQKTPLSMINLQNPAFKKNSVRQVEQVKRLEPLNYI